MFVVFFLIKEFNPNCQLKGIAETVVNYLKNTITLLTLTLKLSLRGSNRYTKCAIGTIKNSIFKMNFIRAQGQKTAGLYRVT